MAALDGVSAGVQLGKSQTKTTGEKWLNIAGFVLIVWIGLMWLPPETVQWFLIAVLVAMLYNYFAP
jgi:ABC-type nickel/cobalt efflux system permease component RcnA